MSKLYVFGIGGTGSRVLKSLTMLLASGVECKDTIVPIIIDPDVAAADLTLTVGLINKYIAVRKQLDFTGKNPNIFFKTDINGICPNFTLPLKNGVQSMTFDQYIGLSAMDNSNQALLRMLFSEKNLSSSMNVGFKGNPNMGSIVLNQFSASQEFADFANNFQKGDRIFIISSIFGGTGASGFPLLLKTLRGNKGVPNAAIINDAPIAAISVLPYFGVQQNANSEIDSSTFISKTKSALSYYDLNISGTNALDALYYIGDNMQNAYANVEGGNQQKDDAHFVELASALAVLDFANNGISVRTGMPATVHKEFGIAKAPNQITFPDLGGNTQNLIKKPLMQFMLFDKYLENGGDEYAHQPWGKDNGFDEAFLKNQFITDLKSLQAGFIQWLKEMEGNKQQFSPFELNGKKLSETVKGQKLKKGSGLLAKSVEYDVLDSELNTQSKKLVGTDKDDKFVELFYRATNELC